MRLGIDSVRGNVAFGVITIREDEMEAVLDRFLAPNSSVGRGSYEIGTLTTADGVEHQFALARCIQVGEGQAQKVANDLIERSLQQPAGAPA